MFAVVQARRREPPRVLIGLGLVSMVLFFGRPTLGFVIDLLPGGGDLFLRRFINGVHLAALYLAGLGLMFLVNLLMGLLRRWKVPSKPVIAIAVVVAALLVTPAVIERVSYERQGGRWIDEQGRFEATDGVGYEALVDRARDMGPGRIFSEQRGPSVSRYRIGQVPTFAALLNLQADAIGFTRPTWSLMSPAEYRFDASDPDMRELFGVRYVIWPEDRQLPAAQRIAQVGRHVLWSSRIPATSMSSIRSRLWPRTGRTSASRPLRSCGQACSSEATCRRSPSGVVRRRNRPGARTNCPRTRRDRSLRNGRSCGRVRSRVRSDASSRRRAVQGVVRPSLAGHGRTVRTCHPDARARMVGVPVPAGEHEVVLTYQAYPWTGPLLVLGALTIMALWFIERRRRRARTADGEALPPTQKGRPRFRGI